MGGEPLDSALSLLIVLDENIAGEELRDALTPIARAHDATVSMLHEFFARGTKDPDWMPTAAQRKWAVISCDANMKRRPAENQILMTVGMCIYILRGQLNREQIRLALAKAIPRICKCHRQHAAPIICHISRDGDVDKKYGERNSAIRRQ